MNFNDNNEKKVTDSIKDTGRKATNEAKKTMKNFIKTKIIALALPIILKLLLVFSLISAIFVGIEWIREMLRSVRTADSIYSELEANDLADLVEIKGSLDSGYYIEFKDDLELDEKFQNIIQKFEVETGYLNIEDKELLKKFIMTELVTTFPDLGGEIQDETNQFQGAVKIRRVMPDKDIGEFANVVNEETGVINSRIYDLKYMDEETFDRYIEEGRAELLQYFTLNEDKMLIVANWQYDSGAGLQLFRSTPINYRDTIEKYSMPYEYLTDFWIDSRDREFSEGLADIAMESEFIIAVQDNVNVTKESHEYCQDVIYEDSAAPTIELTYVDCWFARITKTNSSYNVEDMESNLNGQVIEATGTVARDSRDNFTEHEVVIATDPNTGQQQKGMCNVSDETYKYLYNSGDMKAESDGARFIELFNERNMKNKIRPKWIFSMLGLKSKTANLVDITKYLFYEATGIDYENISESFDIHIYEDNDFSEYRSAGGDFIVKTDEEGAAPTVTAEQLRTGIVKWISGQAQRNALDLVDVLIECQEQNKVNAVFTLSVLRAETTIGVNSNHGYNWMSWFSGKTYNSAEENVRDVTDKINTGNVYFRNGRISVYEIGEVYCADPPPPAWANNVSKYMRDLYSAMGVEYSSSEIYQEGSGNIPPSYRPYREYKQYDYKNPDIVYKATPEGTWGTIAQNGCMPTSISIILSGYGITSKDGSIFTPETVVTELHNYISSYNTAKNIFSNLGFSVGNIYYINSKNASTLDILISHLESGGAVLAHCNKGWYASQGHYMAILGVRNGKEVYISNPGRAEQTGWVPVDLLYERGVNWFTTVSK